MLFLTEARFDVQVCGLHVDFTLGQHVFREVEDALEGLEVGILGQSVSTAYLDTLDSRMVGHSGCGWVMGAWLWLWGPSHHSGEAWQGVALGQVSTHFLSLCAVNNITVKYDHPQYFALVPTKVSADCVKVVVCAPRCIAVNVH